MAIKFFHFCEFHKVCDTYFIRKVHPVHNKSQCVHLAVVQLPVIFSWYLLRMLYVYTRGIIGCRYVASSSFTFELIVKYLLCNRVYTISASLSVVLLQFISPKEDANFHIFILVLIYLPNPNLNLLDPDQYLLTFFR